MPAPPDSHPFWKAESEPLPEAFGGSCGEGMETVLCHRKHEVVALTAGQYPVMEHPFAAENTPSLPILVRIWILRIIAIPAFSWVSGTDSMLAFYAHGMPATSEGVQISCFGGTVSIPDGARWRHRSGRRGFCR